MKRPSIIPGSSSIRWLVHFRPIDLLNAIPMCNIGFEPKRGKPNKLENIEQNNAENRMW